MKRKFTFIAAIALLAALCLGAFASCAGGIKDADLKVLVKEVEKLSATANGKTSYTLKTTVSMIDVEDKEITCKVNWTADSGVTVTDGDGSVTVTVPSGVSSYILTGTLVDDSNKKYEVDGNPVTKAISVTDSGNQGGNQGGDTEPTMPDGAITAAQAKAEAESLNLDNKAYSEKSYKVAAYVVAVNTKDLSGTTVYDLDLADTAGADKVFALYHGNLVGSAVPAVGDRVLATGHITRYDYSDGTVNLQLGGNQSLGFATVEVLTNGQGGNQGGNQGTTTPGGDSGNQGGNQGGSTTTPSGEAIATISLESATPTSSSTANQKVYTGNGLTVTNDKSSSTTDCRLSADTSARFYKGSTIKVEHATAFKTIVITADDYKGEYMGGFDDMTVAGATITRDGSVITIVLDTAATSFISADLVSQLRIRSIAIYA